MSTAPSTHEPAMQELSKSYTPAESEAQVSQRWAESGVFHVEPGDPGDPYCIVIPPPNVTAALHLGHALNNTLQDVLIRYHRMRGFKTLWMPGTDHAGIATQTVVEKRLLAQGIKRREMGREAFVEKVQEWKDEYEATITEQLKAFGCSCDWARQRFTMDAMCAKAVREAFFRLFKDGLIYRGKRLVNWDPVTQTALADDEVEMKDVAGHMWYLRYPLESPAVGDPEFITVATTRPETMLGDTAVAVNPDDPDRKHLIGKKLRLPIVDRVIEIIGDDYVVIPAPGSGEAKAEYASGFLKVTPAHDTNDWDIGVRHDLDVINVLAPDASISSEHGWPAEDVTDEAKAFLGMTREDAREAVVAWFKNKGLLENVREYSHSVGHSYRSHVPIEPYLSDQWYVKVSDDRLVGEAQRALADEQFDGAKPGEPSGRAGDNELTFHPPRYAKTYQLWHENLRDWCISRQLWWGHRIAVWRRDVALREIPDDFGEAIEIVLGFMREDRLAVQYRGEFVPLERVEKQDLDLTAAFFCVRDPDGEDRDIVEFLESRSMNRDPDVLDTWFSSALWPLSTMGWPAPDSYEDTAGLLDTFNPTSVLCTGRDIITLWVSRMVMFNRHFNEGKVPYRHVYINPMIQDGHGQRMSKSLGNGVDPRDIVHSHGADAMRFTLTQIATATQDVRLPVDMVSPHSGEAFEPQEITSPQGYRVAAPVQTCSTTGKKMVSGYGAASGEASPGSEMPLARNSSSKFDLGRNFCNKLWNATRFALGNISTPRASDGDLALADRWILSRLAETQQRVDEAVRGYQFSVYAEAMYDFIWRDFCDWYLESIKPTVKDDPQQQQVLLTTLNAMLRLLHPVCPFVTEALWPHVAAAGDAGIEGIDLGDDDSEVLAGLAWPRIDASLIDQDAGSTFERVQALVSAIRQIRAEKRVPPRKKILLYATDGVGPLLESAGGIVEALAGLESVADVATKPKLSTPLPFEGEELALGGLVDEADLGAERERLEKLIAEKKKAIGGFKGKLSNSNYVDKAPAHVVDQTRQMLAETEADLAAAQAALASMGNG